MLAHKRHLSGRLLAFDGPNSDLAVVAAANQSLRRRLKLVAGGRLPSCSLVILSLRQDGWLGRRTPTDRIDTLGVRNEAALNRGPGLAIFFAPVDAQTTFSRAHC